MQNYEKARKKFNRKILMLAMALILTVVIGVSAVVLLRYDNSSDYFQLSFGSLAPPTEIDRGTQIEVYVYVDYDSRDHITLTYSGSGAFLTNFYQNIQNGAQYLSQVTITGSQNGAKLIIKVPDYVQTGIQGLTITGTNSAGITSSLTYWFTVT